jgi:hypothetical protein
MSQFLIGFVWHRYLFETHGTGEAVRTYLSSVKILKP